MNATSRLALLTCAAALLALPACESDRPFSLLGYQAGQSALYDCSIHTVRVPIFQNRTFVRGLEFDLTRAVVREIEAKTPYKVVGADECADAEVSGTIIGFTKATLNVNPLNEIREQETNLVVEVAYRDLRTGEFLSDPARRPPGTSGPALPALPGAAPLGGQPGVVPPGTVSVPTAPGAVTAVLGPDGRPLLGMDGKPLCASPGSGKVVVSSLGTFVPEIGQSLTTAEKQNVDRLATQIVSMMEKPW